MANVGAYYGGIVNLMNGEEYVWEGASEADVINDLKKLRGLEYDVHWEFAGDTGLEESDIYEANSNASYYGTQAVANLALALKVEI